MVGTVNPDRGLQIWTVVVGHVLSFSWRPRVPRLHARSDPVYAGPGVCPAARSHSVSYRDRATGAEA